MKTFLLMVVAVLVLNAVCADLPEGFAISSRQETRDYIVTPDSNRGDMAISLLMQYDLSTGSYAQMQVTKYVAGYQSFNDCLADTVEGYQILIDKVKKATNYKNGSNVGFDLSVWYFPSGTESLSMLPMTMVRMHGTRNTLSATKVAESFKTFESRDVELAVVRVPLLDKVEITLSLTNNVMASMVWTKEGVQMSSWPKYKTHSMSGDYFGVSSHLAEYSKVRINLLATDGRSASYTQYGAKITPPLMEMRGGTIWFSTTPGGELDVVSSPSLKDDWRYRGTYLVPKDGRVVIPVRDGNVHFYRGICR